MASLAGREGRQSQRRARDHRRVQSRLSVSGDQRVLSVVAQEFELEVGAKCSVVSTRTSGASTRLQLAQHDRFLVCRAVIHRRDLSGGHLVHVGWKPRLSDGWRNTAGATRERKSAHERQIRINQHQLRVVRSRATGERLAQHHAAASYVCRRSAYFQHR